LAITFSRPYPARILPKERVYKNNPQSMEELKHDIEHNVASTGPEILRKVARNTLKRADFFSEKVMEIFSICC
jgi:hypothetical protein